MRAFLPSRRCQASSRPRWSRQGGDSDQNMKPGDKTQTVVLRFNLTPLLCTGLMSNSQELAQVNKVGGRPPSRSDCRAQPRTCAEEAAKEGGTMCWIDWEKEGPHLRSICGDERIPVVCYWCGKAEYTHLLRAAAPSRLSTKTPTPTRPGTGSTANNRSPASSVASTCSGTRGESRAVAVETVRVREKRAEFRKDRLYPDPLDVFRLEML